MPYLSTADAVAYHQPAEGASAIKLEIALGLAADVVSGLAPYPEEPTEEQAADYVGRARRAEAAIFAYGWSTDWGTLSSKGISDLSKSYRDDQTIQRIVRASMGRFYVDPETNKPSQTAYVGPYER